MERPNVVLGDRVPKGMTRGAGRLGRLLGLTLGPLGRNILLAKDSGSDRYEVLTDGATIVRRIIALPEPVEDMGAMLLRQLVWRVRQQVGDGSATAGVLALGMLRGARRCVAAGANPMRLRAGIDLGVAAATRALAEMAEPLEGQERLAALATSASGDPDLGRVVGEIFDTIGLDGTVNIQEFVGPYLDRAYVEGHRFKGTFTSRFFLTDVNHRLVQLAQPYIFISDWNLSDAAQVHPLLELVLREGEGRPLLVVSASQDGAALSTLLANHQKQVVQCCGVTLKGVGDPMRAALDDLALVTGGRFLFRDAHMAPSEVTLADLGRAARVEVDEDYVTVFEGSGDRKAIHRRRQTLRAALADARDDEAAQEIRERVGRLSGGIGVLKIGALVDKDRERRRQQAEEAVKAVAAAVGGGVVPGGGAAYLAAIPAVEAVPADDQEVRYGLTVVARALEEPMRHIVANAGLDPDVALARVRQRGPTFGVNVLTGQVTDMRQARIVDSSRVLQAALQAAASGACMVLTTGAVILHRKPELSVEP